MCDQFGNPCKNSFHDGVAAIARRPPPEPHRSGAAAWETVKFPSALVADRADAMYCGDVCRLRAHKHRINRAGRVRMLLDVVKAPVALSGGPAGPVSW
jgi:hypothetical protein